MKKETLKLKNQEKNMVEGIETIIKTLGQFSGKFDSREQFCENSRNKIQK